MANTKKKGVLKEWDVDPEDKLFYEQYVKNSKSVSAEDKAAWEAMLYPNKKK